MAMETMVKNKGVEPAFILVNDIHINKQNGNLVKDIFKQILNIANRLKISQIIIGGDIFTNRSGQPLDCLSTFQDILDMSQKSKITINVIPGNHDKTDPDDYRSYLDIYRGNNYFNVYREGVSRLINGCVITFVPYFNEDKWKDEFLKALNSAKEFVKSYKRFLITHIAIDGVCNNDGSRVVSELKADMFKFYTKVLIGHYHNSSYIGKNVYYTGSAYQGDFGEDIDKGCVVVYKDGSFEKINLRFPKYIKHVIDVNDTETLRNLLEKYDGENYNHIRFIFQGQKVDASKVDLNYISSKGIQCTFESIEEKDAINDSVNKDALNYDKRNLQKDFLRFCSKNDIRGKHMKYGLNLIKNI